MKSIVNVKFLKITGIMADGKEEVFRFYDLNSQGDESINIPISEAFSICKLAIEDLEYKWINLSFIDSGESIISTTNLETLETVINYLQLPIWKRLTMRDIKRGLSQGNYIFAISVEGSKHKINSVRSSRDSRLLEVKIKDLKYDNSWFSAACVYMIVDPLNLRDVGSHRR